VLVGWLVESVLNVYVCAIHFIYTPPVPLSSPHSVHNNIVCASSFDYLVFFYQATSMPLGDFLSLLDTVNSSQSDDGGGSVIGGKDDFYLAQVGEG
jgi:hypothetical protein